MKSFTELKAWQLGIELVKEVYLLTGKFPKEELYGLTSQLRRSCTSIVANIAEGFGRYTYPDKAHKYTIARGECAEAETELFVAIALGFISQKEAEKAQNLLGHIGRAISGLINSCKHHS